MKKASLLLTVVLSLGMLFGLQVKAQGRIDLNGAKSAQQCANLTEKGFNATFSFASIESSQINTEKGVFSEISMNNTFSCGNPGEPSLPAAQQLVAIPFGATNVSVEVKSYSTTTYNLADYGISTIAPQQLSVRKDQTEVPFYYNEKAYAVKGYAERPIAQIELQGKLRGIQVAALTVNPVQYDAANNTIKVFNDIELTVNYGNYDAALAYDEFARTASVYFAPIYRQMFNWRDDVYTQHPDLWQAPVKMLVITDRMFEETLQDWISWKTTKGFYMDVNYTSEIGTSAAAIKTFCQNKYAEDAPTFLIIIGDKNQVAASATGSETHCVTDLYYESIDNDYFPDMLHSRIPVETVSDLENVLEKSLQYEQYTMPDPSYLSNTLLIAGWDSAWNPKAGVPTIQYAVNYYYNAEHGFNHVYDYYNQSQYPGCYNNMNTGVGFVNYTAHGSNTSWADPSFTTSNVNSLTNTDKYFLAMGNCCQAADWGISGACLGEAMIRAQHKGAYAYIGGCPSTYWYEDYYFGVGATNVFNNMPTFEQTTTGVYDGIWMDDAYNTVQSIVFLGNIAVTHAHVTGGYTTSVTPLYYWQCYHTLGDASVMPYRTQPIENTISHMAIFPIGMNTYEVSADPGSYVAVTMNGVLHGAGLVDETGTISLEIEPVTAGGEVTLCVTHPQRVPSIEYIPAAALEGAYISVDTYTPANAHVGDESSLAITFKNVGNDPTTGTTNVTISCEDENLTIINGTASFNVLAPEATVELQGFSYQIAEGVADGTKFRINTTATCGSETWEGKVTITAGEAVLEFAGFSFPGSFVPGESLTVTASFKNTGHYMATNAIATIASTNEYVSFENESYEIGTIDPNGVATCIFNVSIAANCPETEQIALDFTMTANGGLAADGNGILKNSCVVIFDLHDSYGDGWNGNKLHVVYSDGTPAEDLTINSGNSETIEREIGNGVHVTVSFIEAEWASECSYEIKYEDGTIIFQGTTSGTQFDVNCAGSSPIDDLDPVENLAATLEGNTVILTWDAIEDALSYRVSRNGVVLGETTDASYTDAISEELVYTYSVVAIYADGESVPANVVVEADLNVEENETNFNIYPNPANNMLYINGGNVEYSYIMYNGLGQQVANGTAQGALQINVSNMTKGVYFIRLTSGVTTCIEKVIVE